ncbi:MAG: integration host factor subunit alpha [Deltaproteobacteria bacterium]|nr:integration host factor subunit alpha [Deltaproteobacteria bacterium]
MTKAEIVDHVYDKVGGFSKKEATDLVDMLFEMLKERLAVGAKIKLSGFGNFVVKVKRQRWGLNPRTKERITLPTRRVVRFKPSPVLKSHVNKAAPTTGSNPVLTLEPAAAAPAPAPAPTPSAKPETPPERSPRSSRRG